MFLTTGFVIKLKVKIDEWFSEVRKKRIENVLLFLVIILTFDVHIVVKIG